MTMVNQKFIETYLYRKVFEAVKNLNEVRDALDPKEAALLQRFEAITKELMSIEF